ncbi:MAG: glycosyltransferase family 2 protein [Gaiellaceae bacterium MAG52_C11]|nr:glycosyltransferase family 2 protein [Candidatus Gaiellasilicea maunaloa]
MALVDVVVVSYNSTDHLRACIAPLAGLEDAAVIVVDNASADDSLDTIADLPVKTIRRLTNGGFATGCNAGWRAGSAPFVLFLNPDATIDESSLHRLVAVLEEDERIGAVAPRIEHPDGSLVHSLRRFPRLRSTFSRALYLHRLWPRSTWTDELVRDESSYRVPSEPEWVSGACLMARRSALEQIGGWDEGFFFYSEDIDLCRRLWAAGLRIRFEPAAIALHAGGASAPRSAMLPLLTESRLRYADKHGSRASATLARVGLALGSLTRVVLSRGGVATRRGHARALARALSRAPAERRSS